MYYPVMNVTQCEGRLSTYHLNGGSMTTPQSEEKEKKKKKKRKSYLIKVPWTTCPWTVSDTPQIIIYYD